MAQGAAVAVASPAVSLDMPWLDKVIYGGSFATFDRETAPNVKEGLLRELGHVDPTGNGLGLSMGPKTFDFESVASTGVGYTEGKPILKIEPKVSLKINSPTYRAMALALFADTPSKETQAVVSTDTIFDIPIVTLDVWYYITPNITKLIASKDATGTFTDYTTVTDYTLDTAMGRVKFLSTGTVVAGDHVQISYQSGVETDRPYIVTAAAPRFVYGGLHIHHVVPPVGTKTLTEVFWDYFPRCRVEPSGAIDINNVKPAEITLDFFGVPSPEIPGQPFGFTMKQIYPASALRSIA